MTLSLQITDEDMECTAHITDDQLREELEAIAKARKLVEQITNLDARISLSMSVNIAESKITGILAARAARDPNHD